MEGKTDRRPRCEKAAGAGPGNPAEKHSQKRDRLLIEVSTPRRGAADAWGSKATLEPSTSIQIAFHRHRCLQRGNGAADIEIGEEKLTSVTPMKKAVGGPDSERSATEPVAPDSNGSPERAHRPTRGTEKSQKVPVPNSRSEVGAADEKLDRSGGPERRSPIRGPRIKVEAKGADPRRTGARLELDWDARYARRANLRLPTWSTVPLLSSAASML